MSALQGSPCIYVRCLGHPPAADFGHGSGLLWMRSAGRCAWPGGSSTMIALHLENMVSKRASLRDMVF